MAMLVVAETHVPDIVSTLSEALRYVSTLIDSDEVYMRSSYVVLRESILNLSNQLNNCKSHFNDEVLVERERLLLRARISASKTFSLVYYLYNNPHGLARSIFCPCACFDTERVERLQGRSDETLRLADDVSTFLRGTRSDQQLGQESHQQHGQESEELRDSSAGVNRLEMVTPRNLDSKITKGEEVPFTVSDSSQRLVYTVTTWLNNPQSWGNPRRMSASLENATAGTYNIRHPEEKQSISGRKEMNAFIFSGGSLQGTVTSVLTGSWFGRAGSLLLRDHYSRDKNGSRHYSDQRYDVLLVFSHINILGLHSEGVGRVRLHGLKKREKTYYECFVEATGEVLAIYRHNQEKKTGVLYLLGVGNKPEVRDLIFSTLIAMGLTRAL